MMQNDIIEITDKELSILKILDIPYIDSIWIQRQKGLKEKKYTFLYYLSYVRLPDFRRFGWKDSDDINNGKYDCIIKGRDKCRIMKVF